MSLSVDPSDRKLFIVLGGLLCAVLAALILISFLGNGYGGIPSSHSNSSSGARAAYLLLRRLGYPVRRWTEPPSQLPSAATGVVLVVADPEVIHPQDLSRLREFVARGGRVVATGPMFSLAFERQQPILPAIQFAWKRYHPVRVSPLTRGVRSILLSATMSFTADDGTPFRGGGLYPIKEFRYGRGTVVWWASAVPLTNSAISRADNAELLLNSVGNKSRQVLWDEYFHTPPQGVWSATANSSFKWVLLQLGLLAVLVCFTWSRHFGAVRPLQAQDRHNSLEFIDSMAALFAKARASNTALAIVYEDFRASLQRRLGMRPGSSVQELAAAIRPLLPNRSARELQGLLERVEAAAANPRLDNRQANTILNELHRLQIQLGFKRKEDSDAAHH